MARAPSQAGRDERDIGGYRVVGRLASYSDDAFEAVEQGTGDHVVLLLAPKSEDGAAERFATDAAKLARVERAVLPAVRGTGTTPDGRAFVAQELVEGQSLADILLTETLPPARAVRLVAELADGLEGLHRVGLLHRRLSPASVLIRPGPVGHSALIGVGLGVARRGQGEDAPRSALPYLAPEELAGSAVDERADVHALAAMLFHALTGGPPFSGSDRTPPRAVSALKPTLPAFIDDVVFRGLAPSPKERPGAAELVEAAARALLLEADWPALVAIRAQERQGPSRGVQRLGDPDSPPTDMWPLSERRSAPRASRERSSEPENVLVAEAIREFGPGPRAKGAREVAARGARLVRRLGRAVARPVSPARRRETAIPQPEPPVQRHEPAVTQPEPPVQRHEPAIPQPEPPVQRGETAAPQPEPTLQRRETAVARPASLARGLGRAVARPVSLPVGLLAVALAVGAGLLLADPGDRGGPRAASTSGLRLPLPGGWRSAAPAPVGDTRLSPAVAATPGSEGTLQVGFARDTSPLTEPAGVVAGLDGDPRTDVVRTRSFEGYRVRGLTTGSPARPLTLLVVPTSEGSLLSACVGSPGASSFVARCERVAGGLSLRGARPLPLRDLDSYTRLVGATVRRLARQREAGRRTLRRARTRGGQARAAASLGAANLTAARRLERADTPDELEGASDRLVASLRRTARAYASLSRNARRGDSRRYVGARAAVERSEARVARALRALTRAS